MKVFQCSDCYESFENQPLLVNHVKSVHIKEKQFKCESCEKTFTTQNDLKFHENIHSSTLGPVICEDYCGQRLSNKYNLLTHIRRVHIEENEHKCEHCICHSSFKSLIHLKIHIAKVHKKSTALKELKVKCEDVKTDSETASANEEIEDEIKNEVNYVQSTTEDREYDEQPKNQVQSVGISDLLKSDENSVYRCGYCSNEFNDHYSINVHMYNHYKNNNNQDIQMQLDFNEMFQCIVCRTEFNLEQELDHHIRMDHFN